MSLILSSLFHAKEPMTVEDQILKTKDDRQKTCITLRGTAERVCSEELISFTRGATSGL